MTLHVVAELTPSDADLRFQLPDGLFPGNFKASLQTDNMSAVHEFDLEISVKFDITSGIKELTCTNSKAVVDKEGRKLS